MVTKLKNSMKSELLFAFWCFVWMVLFTMTKNLFSAMEVFQAHDLYDGNAYDFVLRLTITGAFVSLFMAVLLILFLWKALLPIWRRGEYSEIILDKIPMEIIVIAVIVFWYFWRISFLSMKMYNAIEAYYFIYARQIYYLLYDGLRVLRNVTVASAGLCFFLWLFLRRIVYHRCVATSLLFERKRIYQYSSALGRKISRRRGILTAAFLVSTCSGIAAILSAYHFYEPQYASAFFVLFLVFQLFGAIYLKVSGVTATAVNALIEQIRAISHAEPLHEEFRLSEKSLFYESFHQLEQIESAVRRSAEKQLQAERLKIDLITNVSHDLKTPLTSMVGYTDLLKQEKLSAEARDYVDVIALKQEQLKEMIQQLFELSKVTSGAEQFKMENLDMRKLVEQILGDMDDSIQKSGRTIRSNFDESPLLFIGDNEKMYRVVQNLLENALKYSLENTRIYITVKKEETRICLTIKNIASYEMDFMAEEITERFVRGDKSRSTEGHGLGLAIASSFTQNMGGILLVEVDGDLFKVRVEFPQAET